MLKFRQHRGDLSESMETVFDFENMDQLLNHIRGFMGTWGFEIPDDRHLAFRQYTEDGDSRIKWDQLWIVTLQDWGVVGYTNGKPN